MDKSSRLATFKHAISSTIAAANNDGRATGLVAALMGATFLLMVLTNPREEALRVPDVVKLVASGMFLGVGLAGLTGRVNFANSRKHPGRPPRNE